MAVWWLGPFSFKTKSGNRVTFFGAFLTVPLLAWPWLASNDRHPPPPSLPPPAPQ